MERFEIEINSANCSVENFLERNREVIITLGAANLLDRLEKRGINTFDANTQIAILRLNEGEIGYSISQPISKIIKYRHFLRAISPDRETILGIAGTLGKLEQPPGLYIFAGMKPIKSDGNSPAKIFLFTFSNKLILSTLVCEEKSTWKPSSLFVMQYL